VVLGYEVAEEEQSCSKNGVKGGRQILAFTGDLDASSKQGTRGNEMTCLKLIPFLFFRWQPPVIIGLLALVLCKRE
jgi:hypothetical protein